MIAIARRGNASLLFLAAMLAPRLAFAQTAPDANERPRAASDAGAPVEGEAGPATSAGTTGLVVRPGLEIIAAYDLSVTKQGDASTWFHEFDLPRAHGSLDGAWGPVRARLVVEAVRSEEEGALLGVAGDSLVFRVREASAAWQGKWFGVNAGVVPTLTIPELDGTYHLRAVSASALELTGLESPADLGATARVTFPDRYGSLAIGAFNGEGYSEPELNRGKNLAASIELHPAPAAALPLAVFASGVLGSEGVGSARSNRVSGGLLWQGVRIRGGVVATFGQGVGENGAQRTLLVDAFARTEPIPRLIFGVRAFYWVRDLDTASDAVGSGTIAAGYRVFDPLEGFLALTRTVPQSTAATSLPGLDRWDIRVIGHVVF